MKYLILASLWFGLQAHAMLPLVEEVRVLDPKPHRFLRTISRNADIVIDHVSSQGYEVYGPRGLHNYLKQIRVPFVERAIPVETRGLEYPSPEQTIQSLVTLAKQFPQLIQLIEIGKSVKGRPLVFAKITAPASQGNPIQNRPEFKYIANMHGDEIVGRELMLKLVEDLATNYGKDGRISNILNTMQIYIMPSMNPDGAAAKSRFNANGVDLNRNFPDFTTPNNINTPNGRAPEVQAIMKFQGLHHFKLSANFHGGAEVVNYPWDAQPAPFPLDNLVKKISLDYSSKVPYIYGSTEFPQGITNGYAWYLVNGGMQDWSYHWYNDIQITIELTNIKWPSYSTVAKTYLDNRNALLGFIEDMNLIH